MWAVTCRLLAELRPLGLSCTLPVTPGGRGWGGEEVIFKGRFGNNFLNLISCFSGILKGCAVPNTHFSVQLNLVLLSQNSVLVEIG